MKQQENRRLFFIQLHENFFNNEDLQMLEQIALENSLDPSQLQLFYLKLILASLKTEGLISSEKDPLTPHKIKFLTNFKTNNTYLEDVKLVDKFIEILINSNLVTMGKNDLLVNKALLYTMNKLESSQNRLEQRRKIKARKERLLEETSTLDEFEKDEIAYQNLLENKLLPGLTAFRYASTLQEAREKYQSVFDDLKDFCTNEEIEEGFNLFFKAFDPSRSLHKIADPQQYLLDSIWNNIRNIARGNAAEYDKIFDYFYRRYEHLSLSDLNHFKGLFAFFEQQGHSRVTIARVAFNVFCSIKSSTAQQEESINSLVSYYQVKMDEVLNKETDKKRMINAMNKISHERRNN